MLPNTTLPSVQLTIPSDRFFDAMREIGDWFEGQRIVSPYSTCSRNLGGEHSVCFAFPQACDAASFAARFAGRLAA